MVLYPIIAGIVLGLAQFFSESFCAKCLKYYHHIVSFSAGVGVTYVFLDLFPNFSSSAALLSRYLFLSALLGFGAFHLVEKYIYQHSHGKKLAKFCTEEEYATSFIYHVFVGIVLVSLWRRDEIQSILFFIPMLLFTIASTLPIPAPRHSWTTVVLSSSTLLGILIALFVFPAIPQFVHLALLGFVLGVITFTVIRHALPMKKDGKPWMFFIGAVLYTIVIIATWILE